MSRFVIFRDRAGAWRWHLKASNGRIVAQGEAHGSRRDARRAVEAVRRAVASAIPVHA